MRAIHKASFTRPWSLEVFQAELAKPTHSGFALKIEPVQAPEHKLIAFILFQLIGEEGEILTLATRPDQQRKGYGRTLLAQSLAALQKAHVSRVHLEVASSNLAARNLYENCGFLKTGTRKGYYPLGDGQKDDAILMTKALGGKADGISLLTSGS